MNWKSFLAVGAASASVLWSQAPSMHPRPNMHDYRVQAKVSGATLAASVLTPADVRSSFTIDLAAKGYTVVEVAFYPDQNNLKISPEDFTLRLTGDKSAEMRPVAPSVIARALGKKSPSQTPSIKPPVDVSMTNTIGYETYPTYDQNGRPRQTGGVVMGTGVGVGTGVGGGHSAPDRIPDDDRDTIEAELANRGLQEDTISQPTAGYLYFRNSSSKKKDAAYELQYAPNSDSGPVTPVKLVIPKPLT
jgi:hypothetical protein